MRGHTAPAHPQKDSYTYNSTYLRCNCSTIFCCTRLHSKSSGSFDGLARRAYKPVQEHSAWFQPLEQHTNKMRRLVQLSSHPVSSFKAQGDQGAGSPKCNSTSWPCKQNKRHGRSYRSECLGTCSNLQRQNLQQRGSLAFKPSLHGVVFWTHQQQPTPLAAIQARCGGCPISLRSGFEAKGDKSLPCSLLFSASQSAGIFCEHPRETESMTTLQLFLQALYSHSLN